MCLAAKFCIYTILWVSHQTHVPIPVLQRNQSVLSWATRFCFLPYSVFSQPYSLAVSAGTLCLSCSSKTWGHWVLQGISKVSTLDVRMSYIRAQRKARLSCNCIFPPWAKIHLNWTFVLTLLCYIFSRTCLLLSLCAQSSWCSFVMLNMLVCFSTFVQKTALSRYSEMGKDSLYWRTTLVLGW